ncbi:hypothetical protein TNCV_2686721 [Trichonephila clavipes]|nr:hypothetical protein TNCV_2686721 [Trichonephila clavipes]
MLKPLLINKSLRPRARKDLTVDGVVGPEGDNDEEEKSTPLIGKLIQEGLQLCSKFENHFLINDPNSERASKLQCSFIMTLSEKSWLLLEVLQCQKKVVIAGPDYMVDALKLPNEASRGSGESLQKCVAWRCPDGTQHLFCWQILAISGQSLASNNPVVDSRDLNLVFYHAETTFNK